MSYNFDYISNTTHLVPFSEYYKISEFDSGIEEYNKFLIENANYYQDSNISNTQLLINNLNGDVIGYFSLCMSSIKLTIQEKENHDIESILVNSIPVLKIGKLSISDKYGKKGYGSYLIELVRGISVECIDNGIACKCITVDADVQYNKNTVDFYTKNGFLFNESFKRKADQTTVSMRLDIFADVEELEQTGTE